MNRYKLMLSLLFMLMGLNNFNYKSLCVSLFFVYMHGFGKEIKEDINTFINNIKNYFKMPLSPYDSYGHRNI